MDLDELKEYIKENVTEADFTSEIPSELTGLDITQKKVDARCEASLKERIRRAGKNPFKRWFYLGFGKDKLHNVVCRHTKFDELRCDAFYKWRKRCETKGVTIKSPYFYGGERTFKLYRYEKYHYRNIIKAIEGHFEYTPQTSLYSMDDVFDYLIVKLTILGTYHGGAFSHILRHKEQMHTIWKARKLIINAICAEQIYEKMKNDVFKNKYHVSWDYYDAMGSFNYDKYLEEGIIDTSYYPNGLTFALLPDKVQEAFNSSACASRTGRELLMAKGQEMEEFWNSLDTFDGDKSTLGLFMRISVRKAFEYISQHYYEWGD